jgi:hypothetical protein
VKKKNTATVTRSSPRAPTLPGTGKRAERQIQAAYLLEPALRVLLGKTIEFLLSAGELPEHIAFELAEQAGRVSGREPPLSAKDVQHVEGVYRRFADICGINHDWRREPAYTNGDGDPLPLTHDSLRGLVSKRVPRKKISALIRWMIDNGIVRKTDRGKLALTGERTVILERDVARKFLLDRVATLVPQLLRSELRNATAQDPYSRDVNRDARVFCLPEKYVPLWRQVIRERAGMFMEGVDNWLEDHTHRDDPGPVCEVSVHCYTHTGDSRSSKGSKTDVHRVKRGRLTNRTSRK